jgi:hypothetical protein
MGATAINTNREGIIFFMSILLKLQHNLIGTQLSAV